MTRKQIKRTYRRGDYSLFRQRIEQGTLRVDCDTGRVEILCRQCKEWRLPHIDVDHGGYQFVRIYHAGARRKAAVNRLVWLAANQWRDIPPGHDVHHKDEVNTHNWASNLELWLSGPHRSYHASCREAAF